VGNCGVGWSVLIVDDHSGFRTWARSFLLSEGYNVVGEAVDGRTALEEIERLRPDIVLLDIHLPDMDGFRVARLVGDSNKQSIVLISSRDAEEFGDHIRTSGTRGFLSKVDITAAALEAIIRARD
jgi:DNA-binding NarL/FixJ family response regulator